jgi:hypothetical protein
MPFLLRTNLAPLDRLAKRMEKLELHQPIEPNLGRAVPDHGSGGGHDDYRGEKREGSAISHLIFFPASSFRGRSVVAAGWRLGIGGSNRIC